MAGVGVATEGLAAGGGERTGAVAGAGVPGGEGLAEGSGEKSEPSKLVNGISSAAAAAAGGD